MAVSVCGQSLLGRLQAGDREAFTEIVEEHVDRIYSLAYGMLGNREDAEDACQEVFYRFLRAAPTLGPDSCLPSYLYRVGLNCCRDALRRRARSPRLEPLDYEPAQEEPSPPETVSDRQFRRRVMDCLKSLSSQQRMVFLLRYFHGRSVEETGFLMGLAPGTVKSHMSRAVVRMREMLGENEAA